MIVNVNKLALLKLLNIKLLIRTKPAIIKSNCKKIPIDEINGIAG
jgi:hypothetical protein